MMDEVSADEAVVSRKAVGTALCLPIDRPTVQCAAGEAMAGAQTPLVMHELLLHKVARYVLERPTETWIFEYQCEPTEFYVYVDSNWAAEQVTKKSVSCAVENFGDHVLECMARLSSGEAELYAVVRGGAMEAQTAQALRQLLPIAGSPASEIALAVASDSSVARGICARCGSGRVKHLEIKKLWGQESNRSS